MRRPSPALVISCIALTVALGGTSYATVLQVPRNSVGTLQLKNSAVTSAKVRNRSLLRADFAPGQLPAGPAGPAGPPGTSGLERVDATSPVSSATTRTLGVACPAGKRLLGGGVRLNPVLAQLAVQQSFPDDDNTFRANVREMTPTAATWSITVFATCASAT